MKVVAAQCTTPESASRAATSRETIGKTRRRSTNANSSMDVDQHDQHDSLDGNDITNKDTTTFTHMLEMQQNIFQKCIQSFMEGTNTRFDNFIIDTTKTIADLKQSLQYTQNEVADLKAEMSKMNNQPLNSATDVVCMKEQLRKVEDNIDYIENQSRRNNASIDGIPEEDNETWGKN